MGNCYRLRGNFPEILARSIAESTYGRAKIFEKCSQDATRFYEIYRNNLKNREFDKETP